MPSGPERQPGKESRAEELALPGDFVTAELRSDCARFLAELHRLVRVRNEAAAGPEARVD